MGGRETEGEREREHSDREKAFTGKEEPVKRWRDEIRIENTDSSKRSTAVAARIGTPDTQ